MPAADSPHDHAAGGLLPPLRAFAQTVHERLASAVPGEPEDQLRGPLEALLTHAAQQFGLDLTLKGESVASTGGRPDYAAAVGGALAGHIELKATGKGARTQRYTGRDREQWQRFAQLPNVLYADGNEWALYRTGELKAGPVRLRGDIEADGENAPTADDAEQLARLLLTFLRWQPATPARTQDLADIVAPLCRLLRDSVLDRLDAPDSPPHLAPRGLATTPLPRRHPRAVRRRLRPGRYLRPPPRPQRGLDRRGHRPGSAPASHLPRPALPRPANPHRPRRHPRRRTPRHAPRSPRPRHLPHRPVRAPRPARRGPGHPPLG